MRHAPLLAAALLLASLGACGGGGGDHRRVAVEPQRALTSEGLVVIDLLPGTGEPAARGDRAWIEYTITLQDGAKVDSSHDRGNPLELILGEAPLACLDLGLVGMRAGGKRRLLSPPELGYGARGVPGLVPPNAELVLELELLSVQRGP